MNEITKDLLDALKDAEEALSHVENNLHVRVNPPTPGRMRKAIAKAEAILAATEPSYDDWIPWAGGECPLEYGVIHHVRFRDGYESALDADAPGWLGWKHRGADFDIIAYRVVKP